MDTSIITKSFNGLTVIQKEAFEKSIKEADVNRDNVLDKKEFTEAIRKFRETDEFKSLSAENKESFTEKLKPNAIWGQQGAASVINYDGMEKQTEHYQRLLNDPSRNKGADGKPLVTKAQLDYAKENGFGDMNGDKKITGLELAVADLDGKKGRGAKDGDLNGDGKVNKEDRGVNLGSSSKSNKGLDPKVVAAFIDELIKIWAPQAAGNTSAAQTQAGTQISQALAGIGKILKA
ncbi:MAG: hypothetical protein VKK32_04570 [Candidatus Melainabacteria bacterium]|nr:hypothetical protein [Candidatus Melainabacteria bacterium]